MYTLLQPLIENKAYYLEIRARLLLNRERFQNFVLALAEKRLRTSKSDPVCKQVNESRATEREMRGGGNGKSKTVRRVHYMNVISNKPAPIVVSQCIIIKIIFSLESIYFIMINYIGVCEYLCLNYAKYTKSSDG